MALISNLVLGSAKGAGLIAIIFYEWATRRERVVIEFTFNPATGQVIGFLADGVAGIG